MADRRSSDGGSVTGYEVVEPRAESLVESLRAFGYSTETAVADLVDNSITAKATSIDVRLRWAGAESWIAVVDDGLGMDGAGLREAMRPGTTSPSTPRRANDLGRFGLGLKTASFSQCRRLVVMSATTSSSLAARTWDLDHVVRVGAWQLLTTLAAEDRARWDELHGDRPGTVVLWRGLDRLVAAPDPRNEQAERHFYDIADRVARHLGMTFHRYVTGPGQITIRVNGRNVVPWDPFLESHETTQVVTDESLPCRDELIRVKSFVLPHVSRLTSQEHTTAGGRRGWTSQQGFYIYRNRRLIVSGSWLGLGFRRDELTSLARIRLDLPNHLDSDWQIDVRKSVARAPGALGPGLRRIAEVVRLRSTSVYRHRGKVLQRTSQGEVVQAWLQVARGTKIAYQVNRQHPLVAALLTAADGGDVEALVRLLEETVPVPLIILNHADRQGRQAAPFEETDPAVVWSVLTDVVRAMGRAGMSNPEIVGRMLTMEPFSDFPDLVREVCTREPGQETA
ncbi:ATP-binding protein [Frankia sp. Mgl5]|uniref:ATP-binding protein n=1 Tax=unclassified Frankia TaxID=2632575 RepID=UPI00200E0FE5|nr:MULTISPECIES: ATP-binding protein [unclassified Frankia]MCK9893126.1 ATP-binding protein [Frankia sp. AgB32]MCK9928867.1 ATP-binding protein [Frankia sp. Mgl5]